MGCGESALKKQRRLEEKRELIRQDDVMGQEKIESLVKQVRYHTMTVGLNDSPKVFILNFKNKDTKRLMLALRREKATGKGRIPDMDYVKIYSMREPKDRGVRDFLIDHMPKRIEKFAMDIKPKHKEKDFSYYQYELLKCFDKIEKSVNLYGFKINKNQFELTLKRCLILKNIIFSDCTLFDEEVMLGAQATTSFKSGKRKIRNHDPIEYQIKKLEFRRCINDNGTTWGEDDSCLRNIISGISKSELSLSLKELILEDCGITEEDAQDILDEHNLQVKLVFYDNGDSEDFSGDSDDTQQDGEAAEESESKPLGNEENSELSDNSDNSDHSSQSNDSDSNSYDSEDDYEDDESSQELGSSAEASSQA